MASLGQYSSKQGSFRLLILVLVPLLLSGSATGIATAEDASKLDVDKIDAPEKINVNEQIKIGSSAKIPDLPADWSADLEFILYEKKDRGISKLGTQEITVEDGESVDVAIEHEFKEAGTKQLYFQVDGEITREGLFSSPTANIDRTTEPVTIGVAGELDPDQIITGGLNTPSEVSSEERVKIESSAEIPELPADWSADLNFILYVNEEQVGTQQVSIEDGESVNITINHKFQEADKREVYYRITGEVTRDGPVETKTTQIDRTTETVTVGVSSRLELTTVEGAALPVPQSLEDEVSEYKTNIRQTILENDTSEAISSIKERLPKEVTANSFVVADQNDVYIVFTDQNPTKGLAKVEGFKINKELPEKDLSFGVVTATNITTKTSGAETDVQDVVEHTNDYRLELIKTDAHYRRASVLVDQKEANFNVTAGTLTNSPKTASSIFNNIGNKTRTLSENAAEAEPTRKQIETAIGNPQQSRINTFSFETRFWTDAPATVDGIVLDPAGQANKFITNYTDIPTAETGDSQPILYVVEEDYRPKEMTKISSIRSNAESLDGEVVQINARLIQGKLSVEETIEHGTTTCGSTRFPIPTGQGQPFCANLRTDVLLHAGGAWTTVPQSRNDALPVLGISSQKQDTPITNETGRYSITGEVVASSRFDEDLPDSSVLVIYSMERTGNIDYQEVSNEGKNIIADKRGQIRSRLRSQVGEGQVDIKEAISESEEIGENVQLSNITINPDTINNSDQLHTLTFDVENLSTDGEADEFSIEIPQTVAINSVSSVTADELEDPDHKITGNTIKFSLKPADNTELDRVEMNVKMSLSPTNG